MQKMGDISVKWKGLYPLWLINSTGWTEICYSISTNQFLALLLFRMNSGKENKNGKSHSSWLAQFDWKMLFHFSSGSHTCLWPVGLAYGNHPTSIVFIRILVPHLYLSTVDLYICVNNFSWPCSLSLTQQLLNVGSVSYSMSLCLDTPGRSTEKKASVLLHGCQKTNAKVCTDFRDQPIL